METMRNLNDVSLQLWFKLAASQMRVRSVTALLCSVENWKSDGQIYGISFHWRVLDVYNNIFLSALIIQHQMIVWIWKAHTRKNLGGSGHRLFQGTIPAFTCRTEENQSIRIASLWAKIWTWPLLNTKQGCYLLTTMVSSFNVHFVYGLIPTELKFPRTLQKALTIERCGKF
jgi:hypothetical protein